MSGPQEAIVFGHTVELLSLFPPESPGPDPGLARPERYRADSQVRERWNEPVALTSQDGRTPSQQLDPREVDDRLGARGLLEQLSALAFRLDGEYSD